MGDLPQETDVLVIGGGPGGYVAALRAASFGKKVMLVEKERLGGMCLHYGCIPSKTLIHAANFLDDAKHAQEMGLTFTCSVDLPKLRAWKQSVIDRLTKGIEHLCQKRGVSVVSGIAEFESASRALIHLPDGKQGVEFNRAVIATGSLPIEVPGLPFSHPQIWNAKKALAMAQIPKRLAVVGAGYIGLEMGFMYSKMGSSVTMVEGLPVFLPQGDPGARKLLEKNLESHGMALILDAKVTGFSEKNGFSLHTSKGDVPADAVLVAVGNKPNTQLGLEKAGVKLDAKGFIATNASMQTNIPHIYAIGDVRGMPMLAHKAFLEGKVAGEHACGQKSAFLSKVIPSVMFCDPEIATAGLNVEQANAQGLSVKVGTFPFQASGRALSMNAGEGFVKIVADEHNRILGVTIVGPEASELIGEAVLAIEMGATVEDLALTIHPHPTLSEAFMEAVENFMGTGVHS